MSDVAIVLTAGLLITLISATLPSEWLVMVLSGMILVITAIVIALVSKVPVTAVIWVALGLVVWMMANWLFWAPRRRRRRDAGLPAKSADPALRYWPHLTVLGFLIYVGGRLWVFMERGSTLGLVALYVGGMLALLAPTVAFLERSLKKAAKI